MKLNNDDVNVIAAIICLICVAALLGGIIHAIIGFIPIVYLFLVSFIVFIGSSIAGDYR